MIFVMIFLHIQQMTMIQGWCCVPNLYPYNCPEQFAMPRTTPGTLFEKPSITASAVVTPPTTITPIPKKPELTGTRTQGNSNISTVEPYYSDWTTWSCTENCGGCGIRRRTRMCLSASSLCINAIVEFNNQSCNQHPCPFGKRTCCVNYHLGQIKGHFACVP